MYELIHFSLVLVVLFAPAFALGFAYPWLLWFIAPQAMTTSREKKTFWLVALPLIHLCATWPSCLILVFGTQMTGLSTVDKLSSLGFLYMVALTIMVMGYMICLINFPMWHPIWKNFPQKPQEQ